MNPGLSWSHGTWPMAESIVLHPLETFNVGIPFYRCVNGGSGGGVGGTWLPKVHFLADNRTWTMPSRCLLWWAHLSPNHLSPFPPFIKNERKAGVNDLMRHLVLTRQRKTWTRLKEKVVTHHRGWVLLLLKPHGRDVLSSKKGQEGTWGLLYFYVQDPLQPAWCWHRLASCLNHLLKSRRNIKAHKLVPAISSKNFNWSWEVIGASLGVIKIDS